jgi:hypothetical protein
VSPAAPSSAAALLRAAWRLRTAFGPEASRVRGALLERLARVELQSHREVHGLHELLCFWRAYPDDARLLGLVEEMLAGFARRPDLRRQAARLVNSGIAGTEIRFAFFFPMARWLARRWPRSLRVDWPAFGGSDALEPWLALLAHPAEAPALDEYRLPVRAWIRRLRGPRETDAAFLVRGLASLPMAETAREILYDGLDPPLRLLPGPGTPSRTGARVPTRRTAWQREPLARTAVTSAAIRRLAPVATTEVSGPRAERLVDLAREAMATRLRDLDVFSYGDPRDVRRVAFDGGLEFVCIGALPARRLLLEGVYGYLTLKNGVPVGYVLTAALFGSAEIAYNVFDTYRGAEAAPIYARVLAMTRRLFGCDAFTIVPYQLGQDNDEALRSGAWWFYHKAGFRPRDPAARRLMRAELSRLGRDPSHRSSLATLKRLAAAPLYLHLGVPRRDVMGEIPLANVGLRVGRYLAERFGADRAGARATCAAEAAARLRVTVLARWSPAEREAWERWAPLLLLLPGLRRWSEAERRALVEVVRAKGGRRESEFVRRFDAHAKLRLAVRRLAAQPPRATA